MTQPSIQDLYDVVEATWPPASRKIIGPWIVRAGEHGGQRASATTAEGDFTANDLGRAEIEMAKLGQPNLFMIRDGDENLDVTLDKAGYRIKDPVTLYTCPVETLIDANPPLVSTFDVWPPLQIMRDIWAQGGIGDGRVNVMKRVVGPKTAILSRQAERAAGTAFVAIHNEIAMVHALEVAQALRRKGAGVNIMRAAANWARHNGATSFSLVVTSSNVAANALYKSLGMTPVGNYHYRIKD